VNVWRFHRELHLYPIYDVKSTLQKIRNFCKQLVTYHAYVLYSLVIFRMKHWEKYAHFLKEK